MMGFRSTIFGCFGQDEQGKPRYVSEASFREDLARQSSITPQTLAELRKLGVAADAKLKLEFFFYTDQESKAAALSLKLKDRSYSAERRRSAHDATVFVVTGWTSPIVMTESSVIEWGRDMCRLGFELDCDFDGWGTHPKQQPELSPSSQ